MKKITYRQFFWIGTGFLLLSFPLMFIFSGWFMIMFFSGMILANWSGQQEKLIE